MSKLPNVGTNIFTIISGLAQAHGAINLGQGFPDYPMDEALMNLVTKAMHGGHNQYMPMAGYLPLREAIAQKVHQLYGTQIHPDQNITITPGGTYAIYTAITSCIGPGDEVILFEPAYDSYIPNIEINGGKAVCIPMQYPDYTINWEVVRAAITPRTKMIMINSPHNPTGKVFTNTDMAELSAIALQANLLVLSDEVYEHLIYDGLQHQSVLRYPELAARAFACFSLGKVYNCTGWKIGYCIAPQALTAEFQKVHQFNCFATNSPLQVALASHLSVPETYMGLATALQQKRDLLRALMADTPLRPIPSHGSYFELYSYQGISDLGERPMAEKLVANAGVAVIPTSAFYHNGTDNKVLRFCFAKKTATLEAAVERLQTFFKASPSIV